MLLLLLGLSARSGVSSSGAGGPAVHTWGEVCERGPGRGSSGLSLLACTTGRCCPSQTKRQRCQPLTMGARGLPHLGAFASHTNTKTRHIIQCSRVEKQYSLPHSCPHSHPKYCIIYRWLDVSVYTLLASTGWTPIMAARVPPLTVAREYSARRLPP